MPTPRPFFPVLVFQALEDRITPANPPADNPTYVSDTEAFPARASVKLYNVWDTDDSGTFNAGDAVYVGSGALIDDYHVLTCAHNVYGRNSAKSNSGRADFVYVFAGQDGAGFRPYGEARATNWTYRAAYETVPAGEQFDYDMAVLTLDRNLGETVGHYGYQALSNAELRDATINLRGYPSESPFDGNKQYLSSGPVNSYEDFTFDYQESEVYSAPGSSGSPVYVTTADGPSIVGVHVAGFENYLPNTLNTANRLTDQDLSFINDVLDDQPAPADRPALVSYGTWYESADASLTPSSLSTTSVAAGSPVTVSARVLNNGTAAASNVLVRFRLSTDRAYDSSDTLLGTATIGSLAKFTSANATLTANVPASVTANQYYVVWAIDPDGAIDEFGNSYTNLKADLGGADDVDDGFHPTRLGVRTAAAGDSYEANDTLPTATALGRVVSTELTGLSIHAANNDDHFRFTVAGAGPTTVRLAFTHASGDIDVQVLRPDGTEVGSSTGSSDGELVQFTAVAGEDYVVRAYGFNGALNPAYSLDIDGPTGAVADPFGDIGSTATAADLGTLGDRTLSGLSISTSGLDDYFKFVAADTGTAAVDVAFTHDLGDVDIELLDANGTVIGTANGTSDLESLLAEVTAGETYFVRVLGYDGATNPAYSLDVSVTASGEPPPPVDDVIPADGREPNDSAAAPSDLGAVTSLTVPGLTINSAADTDFFAFTSPGDGAAAFTIRFDNSSGDLDLTLFDAAGNVVGASNTADNDFETVSFTAVAGGRYTARVIGYNGATSGDYSLEVTAPAGTVPPGLPPVPPGVPPVPPVPPGVPPVPPGVPPVIPPRVRVGDTLFAAGADRGAAGQVRFFNPDGSDRAVPSLSGVPGGSRVATGDFNGDGVPDLVVGAGPGSLTMVRVYDGASRALLFEVQAFEDRFQGGVFVAAGDITGDGRADLVITPDEGGGPRVRVFSGAGFGQVADFFGIEDASFRGGARAAVADMSGDGVGDILVAAGFGGGPRVSGFDGTSLQNGALTRKLFPDFFAFEEGLRNGVYLTGGDLDGDGKAELIAGAGPGGGPRVTAFRGADLPGGTQSRISDFFAGDPENRGGVRVAVKDLDGDDRADLVVGSGTAAGSRVTTYAGRTLLSGSPPEGLDFDAFAGFSGGVFVG